jgi:hypothetical protein
LPASLVGGAGARPDHPISRVGARCLSEARESAFSNGALDERQENVLQDLKRSRPSAAKLRSVVHFQFKQDRLILDLVDEIAVGWD